MTEKSGFFVSINGDRKYSADDFGRMFDGVISDGIFQNWGRGYQVAKGSGREIIVQSGRAWFKGHWIENDANKVYALIEGATDGDRYDAITLRVDKTPSVRSAGTRVIQGTSGGGVPQPTQTNDTFEVIIAYIRVPRGAKTNTDFEVTDCRGRVGAQYAQWAQSVMQPKQIALNNKNDFLNAFNNDPNLKRVITRGNNLGRVITPAQKAAIRNGTFDGLWLGDYWQYNDNSCKWIIVDFDRWLDYPNGENQHRITVMSDRNLGIDNIGESGWCENGWNGSKMRRDYANGMVRTSGRSLLWSRTVTRTPGMPGNVRRRTGTGSTRNSLFRPSSRCSAHILCTTVSTVTHTLSVPSRVSSRISVLATRFRLLANPSGSGIKSLRTTSACTTATSVGSPGPSGSRSTECAQSFLSEAKCLILWSS